MKRNLTILLIAAMMTSALALNGCGSKDSEETEETTEETTEEEAEETTKKSSKKSDEDDDDEKDEDKDEEEAEDEEEEIENGIKMKLSNNQNKAKEMPTDTKLYGTVKDGSCWFAFTTDDDEDAEYGVTVVNKSQSSRYITAAVYDEYGSEYASESAYNNGTAVTFEAGGLEPETTYYIRLESDLNYEADFMIIIRNFNSEMSSILEGDSSSAGEGSVKIATNMDDAQLIPVESKVGSTVTDEAHYYAFIPANSGEYRITIVDESADSRYITADIYDEYGSEYASESAYNDGTAVTFSMGELEAENLYFVRITSDLDYEADYTVTIREPEEAEPDPTAEIVDAE